MRDHDLAVGDRRAGGLARLRMALGLGHALVGDALPLDLARLLVEGVDPPGMAARRPSRARRRRRGRGGRWRWCRCSPRWSRTRCRPTRSGSTARGPGCAVFQRMPVPFTASHFVGVGGRRPRRTRPRRGTTASSGPGRAPAGGRGRRAGRRGALHGRGPPHVGTSFSVAVLYRQRGDRSPSVFRITRTMPGRSTARKVRASNAPSLRGGPPPIEPTRPPSTTDSVTVWPSPALSL